MIAGCGGFDTGRERMGRKEDVGRGKETEEGRKEAIEGVGKGSGLNCALAPFIVVAISDGLTQDESGLELQRGHVGLVNLCLLSRGYLL